MAWTSPPTVATGDLWTAAEQNTYLRDNLLWLKNAIDQGLVPHGDAFPSDPGAPALFYRDDEARLYMRTASGTWTEVPVGAIRILEMLKTVDGPGSGLDADKLDGHDSSYFASQSALSAHTGASSAVHGLPANVNVIGSRSGQTVIQTAHGTAYEPSDGDGVLNIYAYWPVAFSSIERAVCVPRAEGYNSSMYIRNVWYGTSYGAIQIQVSRGHTYGVLCIGVGKIE